MPSPRQSIVFTRLQLKFLEAEAARIGISVSELVRRIIDAYRSPNRQRSKT